MGNVLLINPSYQPSYGGARGGIVSPIHPTLGLATIAASARAPCHQVDILDLSWRPYDIDLVRATVLEKKPDVVGITATTPLMNQLRDMSVLVKDISRDILVVGGGAHPSALPEETLRESLLDVVFVAEADVSFPAICDGADPATVKGVWHRRDGKPCHSGAISPIADLDSLPMPAWDLYPLEDYKQISRLLCKRPPITMAEFSRGCVFMCDFCASKITMARGYRKKSPERVRREVRLMHRLGFASSCWRTTSSPPTRTGRWRCARRSSAPASTSPGRAPTRHPGGKRRRRAVSPDAAGRLLPRVVRLREQQRQGAQAVRQERQGDDRARQVRGRARPQGRHQVTGFFMLGLSPDTEETMLDTIEFARTLPVDMMKFGITIAFPGTSMFADYVKNGLIRRLRLGRVFHLHDQAAVRHKTLSYETIQDYVKLAHRKAIFQNPSFWARRIMRGIRTGEFVWDAYYALQYFSRPTVSEALATRYYAPERWPRYDFFKSKPTIAAHQVVRQEKRRVERTALAG